ncbi:unnamed protein product [Mesocestoides corti]|uniref:Carboxylesterase type B domain-containing protein n=2 Tax=Mesocestoides corti TaxID=53468 RepID=A0A0R3UMT9_MESCO|nr:unnamed protein product [Mesocestoides corti]
MLIPTANEWQRQWTERNRKRTRFLTILLYFLVGINFMHIILLFVCLFYNVYRHSWIQRHTLPTTQDNYEEDALHFLTDCVAIYPEYSGVQDWYTIEFLPYAALPRKRAYFAMPVHIATFQECYNAFWLGVHPSKRKFVHGQLRFFGHTASANCLQLGQGKAARTATVMNCLTLSFHFQLSAAANFSGMECGNCHKPPIPVVAYIGGRGMLYHQPKLISPQLASDLGVLYVVIHYRLGIFGFGDFGTQDYGPNHAVEDVRKALQWLHDNARMFGGAAKDLTLIGEDSGASIALAVSADRHVSTEEKNST